MRNKLAKTISASWLAECLGLSLQGPDQQISQILPLNKVIEGALTFYSGKSSLLINPRGVVIGNSECLKKEGSVIVSIKPRFDFVRALQILYNEIGLMQEFGPSVSHPSVKIGQHTVLGRGVEIGEKTVIGHHVVIADGVKIGKYCTIKSHTILGEDGFGFEKDSEGRPIRMLHLGSVVVGDYVEIGSFSTICRGVLSNTIVENYAKIDDHVHIGHNCILHENVLIAAGVVVGGSVEIGKNAVLYINSTIHDSKKIGEGAVVAMGAIVMSNVDPYMIISSFPARPLARAEEPSKAGENG